MNLALYQIDAFADAVFRGNPAAVVPLERWLSDDLMQRIASENNLSETAFFVPEGDGFRLRWFTPKLEVDFCGHATLASAWVLFNELGFSADAIHFETRVGRLLVRQTEAGLEMNFPAFTPEPVSRPPAALIAGVGVQPVAVLRNFETYFVLLDSETTLRAIQPEHKALVNVHPMTVCITAPGDEVDFVSRYFAPGNGIPEDPVTGAIHATLTPYWSAKLGKCKLRARQVSQRGGLLECEMQRDASGVERVLIRGQAVKYLSGTINVAEAQ